jgi:hypothetical protein
MGKRQDYLSEVKARVAVCQTQLEASASTGPAAIEQLAGWKRTTGEITEKVAKLEALDRKWYGIRAELEKSLRAIESGLEPAGAAAGDDAASAPPTPGRVPLRGGRGA